MIEADGWETVHATGGVTRVEPFIECDIRTAVGRVRQESRNLGGYYSFPKFLSENGDLKTYGIRVSPPDPPSDRGPRR